MGGVIAVLAVIVVVLIADKFFDIFTWCKWIATYIHIKSHQRTIKQRFDLYDMDAYHDPVKIGMLPPQEEILLESPQDKSHLQKAGDEISFHGVNSTSECCVVRIARFPNGEVESWIYLKMKNGKAYRLEDSCRNLQLSKDSNKVFSCGGLKMHYIEPMRKWRIFFRGLMREIVEGETRHGKMLYVKFVFQWRASTDCFDTLSDIDISTLASGFTRTQRNGQSRDLTKFYNAVDSYSQGGILRGEVSVGGSSEFSEMYLFGQKIRSLGNITMMKGSKVSHLSGWISKNGSIVHFTEVSIPNLVDCLMYGYMVTPDGKIEVATNIRIVRGQLPDGRLYTKIKFHADDMDFYLKAEELEIPLPLYFESISEDIPRTCNWTMSLNSSPGHAILMKGIVSKVQANTVVEASTKSVIENVPLVVRFSDILCQDAEITGGKGSSLGRLTELSKSYETFIVPDGVVVTTKAYKEFITEDILKEVQNLEDTLYGNISGDVKEACNRAMDAIIQTDVSNQVLEFLIEHLKEEFGDNFVVKKFAVRSSATGEDTEDMSAAGQMETYLGVSGLDQMMISVKKCWASQFSYVAVQYKRQNGQILNSPMAVVIQEMVSCDVAGVLFTCDPLTGNPTLICITSNYGLGESVVSAAAEPDSIVLERDAENNLEVKEKIIGAKSHRFVIKDGVGTTQEKVSEADREACSLSDSLSLHLGRVAINIEKDYGSSRDIEWGFWNNKLYIFQSRPVTSNTDETDYEIDHENDAPMRVENDYFSVCNVGEVMPGATTPLGLDLLLKSFSAIFQRYIFRKFRPFCPKYCPKGYLNSMYNHVMVTATDLFEHINEGEAMVKSQMISLFGRIIKDEKLFELIRERHGRRKKLPATFKFQAMFMGLLTSSRILKKTKKTYENYRIPVENFKTAHDLLEALLYSCTDSVEALICHMTCTNKSTMSNMFLMSTLEKAKGELDTDVYNDLSLLLSSITEVESADVPSTMESLAFHIAKDIDPSEFQKMTPENAEKWLLSTSTESGKKFRNFLEKHGHRCLKEFDVQVPTWGEKPEYLVKMLQSIVGSVSIDRVTKKTKSFHEIVSQMKIPLSTFTRFMLRFIFLPLGQSGVQSREASKSLWIKANNEWRRGYKKLGKLMVAEGRLPDEDLIFFMTLMEIQELLRNRSSKIISRAVHRRRRHKVLDGYIFPEIMSGIPKPINVDSTEILVSDENACMKGIPVSQGVAKGYARVAVNLEEASHIKPGEILLTYSTDIGWTPYFPALAGVGTELGGLISHGAVVSREYGLPCIAGLHGVTRQFQTGDYVLLDGNKGILQKLSPPK